MSHVPVRAKAILTVAGVLVALLPLSATPHRLPAVDLAAGVTSDSADKRIADALVAASGSDATVDDSSATGCRGPGAEPLAYRTDRIVLRTTMTENDAMARVASALAAIGDSAAITGAVRIAMPEALAVTPVVGVSFRAPPGEPVHIVQLARHLRSGPDPVPAAPDYLLAPMNGAIGMWPFGPPTPTGSLGDPRDAAIGAGVTIAVYDVGVPPSSQANRPANLNPLTSGDGEILDADVPPDQIVDLDYGAHTIAIAGVIATLAPGAVVKAARITESNGVATDLSAARSMASTLRNAATPDDWPRVIVSPFGSPACEVDSTNPGGGEMPPLGLEMVTEAVDHHDQTVMLVSAGNRGTDQPFYPAAFPAEAVIAVGALDATADGGSDPWTSPNRSAPPASFSNYGTWVDGWAPGHLLPTTHVIGLSFRGGKTIDGMALVSGTSFAAPYAAALVAEELAVHPNLSGLDAWYAVAATGTACSVDAGEGVAVGLVSMDATATTRAPTGGASDC